jgi:hypothetical protein
MMQSRTERTVWTEMPPTFWALSELVDERVMWLKTSTGSPRTLSKRPKRLRRAATFARKISFEISFEREGRARTRTIVITTKDDPAPR